ncbi:AIR synthase-related protein, partial [Staphylococcus xylosus]|uniref:AIR synthase-related protein n=1 Tax=Staphylococcus xylosus TaxID=1288 RepID=UPI001DA6F24D|nr:phosphoribosylformylglycinamidine synthase II [Staphylococcus xylosus]
QVEKLLYKKVNHEFEAIDLSNEVQKGESIKQVIRNGVASHVQTVGKGGLLLTLARMSVHYQLGLNVQLNVTNAQLFSETQGRYIVAVKEGQTLEIENAVEIGQLTNDGQFKVANNEVQVTRDVQNLTDIWEGAIPKCMTATD